MIDKLKLLMAKNKEFYTFLNKQLKISPNRLDIYELAFLHRSASLVLPDGTLVNNERLEYLGDAVIDTVVADYLFRKFPNEREGFLTRLRSKIVNRAHLDMVANQMDLAKVVVAYNQGNDTLKKRISGEAFEALMGAMYLDKGYDKTRQYIVDHVINNYMDMDKIVLTETDFKSRLMEWGQKYKLPVEYETSERMSDKPKNSKSFTAQVTIAKVPIAKGSGKSKKEAEQLASQKTLTFISSSSEDFSIEAFMHYLERMKDKLKIEK